MLNADVDNQKRINCIMRDFVKLTGSVTQIIEDVKSLTSLTTFCSDRILKTTFN